MTPRVAPFLIVFGLLLVAGAGQWLLRGASVGPGGAPVAAHETRALPGSERHADTVASVVSASHAAGHQPKVASGLVDYHGIETSVACATCHTTRTPERENGVGGVVPKTFHQGLVYAHGGQSCLSCHHSEDYDSLRLADGRKLAFADSQQLCAQCHGPQTRDYLHGSHGGMTGYWDKTRGPRVRNTCADCHDPHAPAYPAWAPVFPPRDAAARQQAEREARAAADHHE